MWRVWGLVIHFYSFQYKTYRNKNVAMAARALINLFRSLNPKLLHRKDRGRPPRKDRSAKGGEDESEEDSGDNGDSGSEESGSEDDGDEEEMTR